MITLDTSVWVNSISSTEPEHDSSRALFQHIVAARVPIFVPTTMRIEMAATLARSGRSAASVEETVLRFASVRFVIWIPLDERMTNLSSDIATVHRLRGADAVFAAVALDYSCKLVSLDKEHLSPLSDCWMCRRQRQRYLR